MGNPANSSNIGSDDVNRSGMDVEQFEKWFNLIRKIQTSEEDDKTGRQKAKLKAAIIPGSILIFLFLLSNVCLILYGSQSNINLLLSFFIASLIVFGAIYSYRIADSKELGLIILLGASLVFFLARGNIRYENVSKDVEKKTGIDSHDSTKNKDTVVRKTQDSLQAHKN